MASATKEQPATSAWEQKGRERWERPDGAVVKYDHTTACNTSRPWLAGHRGYMAFGPGRDEEFNYLAQKYGRVIGPRKWKTPEAAMAAVDKEFAFTP